MTTEASTSCPQNIFLFFNASTSINLKLFKTKNSNVCFKTFSCLLCNAKRVSHSLTNNKGFLNNKYIM